MTDEERTSKFEEMKQKTIARLLGDSHYSVKSYITSCKCINKNKKRIYDNISLQCIEFFKTQAKMRQNGGRLTRIVEEIPQEIPSPIK